MKKTITIAILLFTIILLVSCKAELSSDTFNSKNIFTQDKTFIYEKIQNKKSVDIVYKLTIEDNIATYTTNIKLEDGEYRASSTLNTTTLQPIKSYKGNSYQLHPEKNWDIYANYNKLLDMEATSEGKTEKMSLVIPNIVLDNEALIFSIGAINKQENLVVNVAVIDAAEIEPFKVTWFNNETIKTPYGEYECIRVQLEYTGVVLGRKPLLELWYTNDDNRYLLKYRNATMEMNLKDVH